MSETVLNPFAAFADFTYVMVEKIRARVEKKLCSLTAGDVYAVFGLGIALYMNCNVQIDVDSSIHGAKGLFRPGDWDIILIASQINRQQVFQDNVNTEIYGDLRHTAGGLRVERFGLGPASIGLHSVPYDVVTESGWTAGRE